mmetsp:Transcript_1864/g.3539  ORF Transcript_1864/g.3539 Transcript_1864/m.3539 type:complete len:329 (+) Transcript_1864:2160-3146(+)
MPACFGDARDLAAVGGLHVARSIHSHAPTTEHSSTVPSIGQVRNSSCVVPEQHSGRRASLAARATDELLVRAGKGIEECLRGGEPGAQGSHDLRGQLFSGEARALHAPVPVQHAEYRAYIARSTPGDVDRGEEAVHVFHVGPPALGGSCPAEQQQRPPVNALGGEGPQEGRRGVPGLVLRGYQQAAHREHPHTQAILGGVKPGKHQARWEPQYPRVLHDGGPSPHQQRLEQRHLVATGEAHSGHSTGLREAGGHMQLKAEGLWWLIRKNQVLGRGDGHIHHQLSAALWVHAVSGDSTVYWVYIHSLQHGSCPVTHCLISLWLGEASQQ